MGGVGGAGGSSMPAGVGALLGNGVGFLVGEAVVGGLGGGTAPQSPAILI